MRYFVRQTQAQLLWISHHASQKRHEHMRASHARLTMMVLGEEEKRKESCMLPSPCDEESTGFRKATYTEAIRLDSGSPSSCSSSSAVRQVGKEAASATRATNDSIDEDKTIIQAIKHDYRHLSKQTLMPSRSKIGRSVDRSYLRRAAPMRV